MTNKQALLSLFDYAQAAEIVLINQGIDGTSEYTIADKKTIELASAYLMKSAYQNPDIKQGDNQVTWSRKELANRANEIFKKYGLVDEVFGELIFNLSGAKY